MNNKPTLTPAQWEALKLISLEQVYWELLHGETLLTIRGEIIDYKPLIDLGYACLNGFGIEITKQGRALLENEDGEN